MCLALSLSEADSLLPPADVSSQILIVFVFVCKPPRQPPALKHSLLSLNLHILARRLSQFSHPLFG